MSISCGFRLFSFLSAPTAKLSFLEQRDWRQCFVARSEIRNGFFAEGGPLNLLLVMDQKERKHNTNTKSPPKYVFER
jgi:hypothetical protein